MRPHYSEQWLKDYQHVLAKHGKVRVGGAGTAPTGKQGAAAQRGCAPLAGMSATTGSRVGNPAPSPYRSKLEAAWANYLHLQCKGGEIANWWYEPLNLRLPGKKNWYKPDFLVLAGDGLTFYEIKGKNLSDDRSLVKMKTAAGLNPWAQFILVKHVNGNWVERTIR